MGLIKLGCNTLRRRALLCGLLLALSAAAASGQTLARKGWAGSGITVESWWQSAVLYQIDPFNFQDSKGDGFGDLHGILQRLDYLQSLGVDAIVLSPFPLEPAGSTRAAGQPFDPAYGSEEDLEQLVREALRHKIRLLVDLPLNTSLSGEETLNAARFWLSRGMAGLRLTDPDPSAMPLTAAQVKERLTALERVCASYPGQRVLFWDLPNADTADQTVARTTTQTTTQTTIQTTEPSHHTRRSYHHAATSSPAPSSTPASASSEPQLLIDRRLERLASLQGPAVRAILQNVHATLIFPAATPVPATDSSQRPRSFDRLGDGVHNAEIAKVTAALLLLTRGAPLLYFGQEIGMETTAAAFSINTHPAANAAAGSPTPMQWGTGDAGFTTGVPWIEMGRDADVQNVALEDAAPDSLLNWYRRLSELRHANAALRSGSMDLLNEPNPDIVAWIRHVRSGASPATRTGARTGAVTTSPVITVCNLSSRTVTVSLTAELHRLGIQTGSGLLRTLASSSAPLKPGGEALVGVSSISLPPYGVLVGELRLQPGLETQPAPVRSRSSRRGAGSGR